VNTTPAADPVPWLTERWASYDALTEAIASAAHVSYDHNHQAKVATVVDTLSSLVGGLSDDDRPYAVGFGTGGVNTYTDLREKRVVIGSGPLFDADLNPAQRAAVLTGLAYHEVAHIRHTRRVMAAVKAAWPDNHPDRDLALRASNLADDLYGEAQMRREFPGLAETLPVTLAWVAKQTIPVNTPARKVKGLMFGVSAARYADWFDWTDREVQRDWWLDWAERAEQAAKPADHVAVVQEAVDRVRSGADKADPEPEPERPERPEGPGPEGPEGPSQPGSDDEPTGDGDDEPGEGKGRGGDEPTESDESDDEPTNGRGESKGSDEDEDGDGQPGGDEPTENDDEPGEPPTGEFESDEPKRAKTVTDSGGGDGSTYSDEDSVFVPTCPSEAAKDKTNDDAVQSGISEYRKGQRSSEGDRSYYNDRYESTVQVKRGKAFATRGVNVQAEQPTTVSEWIAPTIGHQITKGVGGTHTGTLTPRIRPDVARVLASAITSERTGAPVLDTGHRSGTLDRTRLARLGTGDLRVFKSPSAPGPQRIRVAVVLDGSSSMLAQLPNGQSRSTATAQIGVDLAGAFDSLPFIDAALYVHNVNLSAPTVTTLWQKGEPVAYAADYARIHLDGNWDDYAIRFVTDDLIEARTGNERLLIVMVSDGRPSSTEDVARAVASAKRAGVGVLSVSVAPDLGIEDQRRMYGANVVEFVPEPMTLARLIAQGIGRALNSK
jgi:hypothetical protein